MVSSSQSLVLCAGLFPFVVRRTRGNHYFRVLCGFNFVLFEVFFACAGVFCL